VTFPGKTVQEKVDPVTGKSSRTIIESKTGEERPRISIKDEDGKTAKLPTGIGHGPLYPSDGCHFAGGGGRRRPGRRCHRQAAPGHHQDQGHHRRSPRVAELFEVRKPKETAVLSEIDGYVSIAKATKKGKQKVTVTPVDVGEKREYLIPRASTSMFTRGTMSGPANP
jgi:DNA-directed RNA polymerase subunit beta'